MKKRFADAYETFIHGINKFILLLQKDIYSYEYIDYWFKFNEASPPQKEDFYSYLNMENVTNAGFAPAKRVLKTLK